MAEVIIDCDINPMNTKVIVDGKELKGVISAEFSVSVNKCPTITLEMYADDITIIGDINVEKRYG